MENRHPLVQCMAEKRKADHLSVRTQARLVDISYSALARMEREGTSPDSISIAKMRYYLGEIGKDEFDEQIAKIGGARKLEGRQGRIEEKLDRIEANMRRIVNILGA